jgi:hypothetical protein
MDQPFEHCEYISYVNNSRINRHNMFNNTSNTYYHISIEPYFQVPWQDTHATALAAVGKSLLIVTYARSSWQSGRLDRRGYHVILVNQDGKEISTKLYIDENVNIHDVIDPKIKALKNLKNQYDEKQLKNRSLFCENRKLKKKYFADLFSCPIINYQKIILNNIASDYLHITLDGEKSLLPLDEHWSDDIPMMVYDQYDKCIITCYKYLSGVIFQQWFKCNKTWEKIGINSWHPKIYNVRKIECSRNHLFVATISGKSLIIVLKKGSSHEHLTEIYQITGCDPVYHDDYQLWYQQGLQILQNENALKSVSQDVLKIILSYV